MNEAQNNHTKYIKPDTRVDFRRTPWRWARDIFDPSSYLSHARLLRKIQKQKDKELAKASIKEVPKIEEAPIRPLEPEPLQKIKVPQLVYIPVKKYKFEVEHKIIKVKLPKIKFSMPALKKIMYVFGIFAFLILTLMVVIISARIISLTEGDFIGEAYKYKINKFENDVVVPLHHEIDQLKEEVNDLQAKKEYRAFEELSGYRPPKPKVFIINKYYKNRKAPITEKISK